MKYLNSRLSAAMWARVLLLWLILAVGAVIIGVFALWMGNFVHNNIKDELVSQQITFSPAENMSEEELAIPGMEENAGLPLTTGNQAKVYSELILLHSQGSAERAGYPGMVYSTLGGVQRELRAAVATAEESGDETAIEEARANLAVVDGLRNTMLTASTLRGNLLSAYGWDNVATGITYTGFGILAVAVVFFLLFVFEWQRGHLPPVEA